MPSLTISTKNSMLSALSIASLSLHSAYSASGANELTGGSPSYARLSASSAAPANGRMAVTGVGTFDVPPSSTIGWLGMWNTSNVFMGMTPNGGSVPEPFAMSDTGTNLLTSASHGFIVGSTVVVWAGSAAALPIALLEGTVYYVVEADTNTLKLSGTLGGVPFAYSSAGVGYLQGITVVTTTGQTTFLIGSMSVDLTIAA